jgi:hypothetical protein
MKQKEDEEAEDKKVQNSDRDEYKKQLATLE